MDELKESITRHVNELKLDEEMLRRVGESFPARLQACLEADGGHFVINRGK